MLFRTAPGIFIVTLLVCLLTAGGHLYSPDEEIMFRVTESIATRARLDVKPIVGPDGETFATRKAGNGREYAQYGVANSLAGVPLYWVGAVVSYIVSDASARRMLDFQTQLYAPEGPHRGHALLKRFFVSFTGAFIAAATAMLIFLFCRRLAKPGDNDDTPLWTDTACGITALAYAVATIALPHARTFFSEPLATLFVVWTFYLLAANRHPLTTRQALAAGTALALAFFTRLDTVFVTPGIGLLLLCRFPIIDASTGASDSGFIHTIRQRVNKSAALCAVGFFTPLAIFGLWQLTMNAVHFGNPFSTAYADQPEGINFSTPIIAGLYGFLFSVGKSIFLFSPAIILGLLGWKKFSSRHCALAVCLAVSIGCKLLIHSSWQNWAGGWCWGPRHIFMVHALMMVPAVAFIGGGGQARRLLVDAVLLWGFLVQIYGASQNFIDYYVLYYRTPYTQPQATVLYGGEDLAPTFIKAQAVGPDGHLVPFPIQAMPAPISDSIYVPQNSQWYRYADMWNAGYTDNLWLRLMQRQRGKEQPIQ